MDDAEVAAGDLVLDLGAGRGVLTAELAARGATVRAVELDGALAAALRTRFATVGAVTIVEADARSLVPPDQPFVVAANLPFAGATAILRAVLDDPRVPLVRAAVVLQWEAAARLAVPWPSSLLAVQWGPWYQLELLRRLAPGAFSPPPAVAAGVLRIVRRADPLIAPADAGAYRRFVARGFRHGVGRVTARRALVQVARELGCERCPAARDLDARHWSALFRATSRSSSWSSS